MERTVAKALLGKRIPRGANFSDSLPDVIASSGETIARSEGLIFGECKHSKNNPWVPYIEKQYDSRLLTAGAGDEKIVLFELNDIHLLSCPVRYRSAELIEKKVPGYMYKHLDQARGYTQVYKEDIVLKASLTQMTGITKFICELPIVIMAKKHSSFRLCYTGVIDLLKFYSLQNDKSYWAL